MADIRQVLISSFSPNDTTTRENRFVKRRQNSLKQIKRELRTTYERCQHNFASSNAEG